MSLVARLTREKIEEICEYVRNGKKIEAIKTLRHNSILGLVESRDFIARYYGDHEGLQRALFDLACLKAGSVFSNSLLKVELKVADVTFNEAYPLFMQILETMYPEMTFEEFRDFFVRMAASRFRPSKEQILVLSNALFDRFYPLIQEEK